MSTKKIQLVGVLNAQNADTLDGKHADEFALATDLSTLQDKVGDKPVSEQIDEAVLDMSFVSINLEGSTSASPNPINADTLGGHTIDSLVDLVAATIPETDVVITTDSKLDSTSENPVQNKVITGEINTLKQQMDDLTYEKINISSFENNVGVVEKGSTVTNVTLNWKTNKETPTALTLSDSAGNSESLDVSLESKSLSGLSLTSDRTWTLTATDDKGNASMKTTKVAFLNGVYHGVIDSSATINSATINSLVASGQIEKKLQKINSTGFTGFTATANEGQHIFFALPASYDTPTFTVGGFVGGFSLNTTFEFANASGHTESYCVWLSDNTGLEETTVKVS